MSSVRDMTAVNSKLRIAFGKRVRSLRRALDMTQEELAEHIDVHRTYISAIEHGGQSVSIDNAARIAKALKTSTSDLFKGL